MFFGPATGWRRPTASRTTSHCQHEQGGWSQAHYQRSVEKEKLTTTSQNSPTSRSTSSSSAAFDRLLIGAPEELRRRVRGAAAPVPARADRRARSARRRRERGRRRRARGRRRRSVEQHGARRASARRSTAGARASGAAAAGRPGIADVLDALDQARVEMLLLAGRTSTRPERDDGDREGDRAVRRRRSSCATTTISGRTAASAPCCGSDGAGARHRRLPERLHAAGGALAVPDGDAIAAASTSSPRSGDFDLVVATRDWHPPDHGSFAAQGGPWPCTASRARRAPSCTRRSTATPSTSSSTRARTATPRATPASRAPTWRSCCASAASTRSRRRAGHGLLRQEHRARRAARGFEVTVDTDRGPRRRGQPGDSERALAELRAAGRRRWRERDAPRPTGSCGRCARHMPRRARAGGDRAVPRDAFVPPDAAPTRRGTTCRCRSARARRSPSRSSSRACASCSSCAATSACSTSAPARATTPRCSPSSARTCGAIERHARAVRAGRARTSRGRASTTSTLVVGDGARGLPGGGAVRRDQRRRGRPAATCRRRSRSSSRPAAGWSRRSSAATSGSCSSAARAGGSSARALERVRFVPLT